ncbi:hypothetical protein [Methylobacterium frigidaeris]|uniref:Uncharacterized protein n=1 Tax=Methylobacterium frigidaeris TaxID=2038277 RepID=A0AA37HDB9_9HYPH|nr:hypothetical protein [Methylobacterium frigidaeris]PIK69799.1 hypothetical protein CS379_27965 [Methylobacterium frigidaeris]GJD63897.1 hypothetical protein MPEAHAMD_4071 [Methylobacterium frigidaeris]
MSAAAPVFCPDDALAYRRSRTRFVPGEGLILDETYRLAHLPLVAPDHPGVIPSKEGRSYARGRHPRVVSLVLPVPHARLAAAPAYAALERELRAAPFAHKIAWDIAARRRDRLHATLCGSLAIGPDAEPTPTLEQRAALATLGPVAVELRGLFSGTVNVGRLYLRVYPEFRDGADRLAEIQRIMGRPPSGLYVVGLHALTDDLDPAEAASLADLIERWWNRPMLHLSLDALWLLWATDDQVLDGGVLERVPLTDGAVHRD